MTLRWVVLRVIRAPQNDFRQTPRTETPKPPTIQMLGEVEAEDKTGAVARAADLYGRGIAVMSQLAFRQFRAEETALQRRNRTRFVDLMNSGVYRKLSTS